MTLKELIHSVDGGQYADAPIYQQLLTVKPEYGSNNRIEIRNCVYRSRCLEIEPCGYCLPQRFRDSYQKYWE